MINDGMFTSNKNYWETPQGFFEKLNREFNFELDVASNGDNAKCERYFTELENGLAQNWMGNVFLQSTLWKRDRQLGEKGI